jgi:RNA polymerase sigma-70 factor (ECF subfamily)
VFQTPPFPDKKSKGDAISGDAGADAVLLERALGGDGGALAELFERHRGRLEQMVRLQGRLAPTHVLQQASLDVARRFPEYATNPAVPFNVWLRLRTGQKPVGLHRQYLGTKRRDAGLEVSLYRSPFPRASSASLAEPLLGRLTPASRAATRAP